MNYLGKVAKGVGGVLKAVEGADYGLLNKCSTFYGCLQLMSTVCRFASCSCCSLNG